MSNVTLFTGGGAMAVPEYLRGVQVDEATKKLAGGGGGLRISIKGGTYRMLNNGEEIARVDDRAMNMVIVASSPDTARTFYADGYVEGQDPKPPTCWSMNGEEPDASVKVKQSAKCATCPQNVAGSGQNDSRACKYSRNLAVTLENDMSGKVFKMSLPAMSLFGKIENGIMPLQAYAKMLSAHSLSVNTVLTEFRFDTSSAVPKLGFKAVRYLSKEEHEVAVQQGKTPEAIEATRTTSFQTDNSASAPLAPPSQSALAMQPVTDANVVALPVTTGNTATVAATPAVTRRRRTKEEMAAASPTTAPPTAPDVQPMTLPNGMVVTPEMLQMMAAMQAMQTGGVANMTPAAQQGQEPVVVQSTQPAPIPQGVAATLAAWDEEEDTDAA